MFTWRRNLVDRCRLRCRVYASSLVVLSFDDWLTSTIYANISTHHHIQTMRMGHETKKWIAKTDRKTERPTGRSLKVLVNGLRKPPARCLLTLMFDTFKSASRRPSSSLGSVSHSVSQLPGNRARVRIVIPAPAERLLRKSLIGFIGSLTGFRGVAIRCSASINIVWGPARVAEDHRAKWNYCGLGETRVVVRFVGLHKVLLPNRVSLCTSIVASLLAFRNLSVSCCLWSLQVKVARG